MRILGGIGLVGAGVVALACGPAPRPEPAAEPASAPPPDDVPEPRPAPAHPRVVLAPPGRAPVAVRVELALTEEEQYRGLMYRQSLPAYEGMLFVFQRPERLTFVMENTYVALDMIFIGANHRVVGVVEDAEPLSEEEFEVDRESQFVLEVNAGFASRHGVSAGTEVRFENVPGVQEVSP